MCLGISLMMRMCVLKLINKVKKFVIAVSLRILTARVFSSTDDDASSDASHASHEKNPNLVIAPLYLRAMGRKTH